MYNITELHVSETYAGQMAGWPSPEEAVKRTTDRLKALNMDGFPVHVVPPAEDSSHPATKAGRQPAMVPKWAYIAMMEGPPADAKRCGSHLVLVWFSDKKPGEPIELPEVDIASKAQDWDF